MLASVRTCRKSLPHLTIDLSFKFHVQTPSRLLNLLHNQHPPTCVLFLSRLSFPPPAMTPVSDDRSSPVSVEVTWKMDSVSPSPCNQFSVSLSLDFQMKNTIVFFIFTFFFIN